VCNGYNSCLGTFRHWLNIFGPGVGLVGHGFSSHKTRPMLPELCGVPGGPRNSNSTGCKGWLVCSNLINMSVLGISWAGESSNSQNSREKSLASLTIWCWSQSFCSGVFLAGHHPWVLSFLPDWFRRANLHWVVVCLKPADLVRHYAKPKLSVRFLWYRLHLGICIHQQT
jgi:hypothetical protein